MVNSSSWSYKAACEVISLGNSFTQATMGQGRTGVQMKGQDKLGQQGEQKRRVRRKKVNPELGL